MSTRSQYVTWLLFIWTVMFTLLATYEVGALSFLLFAATNSWGSFCYGRAVEIDARIHERKKG